MPLALAVSTLVLGVGAWTASLLVATRANRGIRMSYVRNPPRNSPLAIALRALGAGLATLGAISLAPHAGHWSITPLILVAVLGIPLLIIPVHNHRADAATRASSHA